MNKYLSTSLTNIVSTDLESCWAAASVREALAWRRNPARFQQKQMQEREEKLLKLYENQQQRTIDRIGRGSADSTNSMGSTGGGKVRQMFDERRSKAGIDRSYPLEPLKSKTTSRGPPADRKVTSTTRTAIRSTVASSVSSVRNGKPVLNKREVVHSIYNNNNGDETYEEHHFEDDNSNIFNSNSHKDIIEILNKHNLNDNLDDEQLPKIGYDEVDDAIVLQRNSTNVNLEKLSSLNVTKKAEPRSSTGTAHKENINAVKRTSRPSPTAPVKTLSSPRTTTPTSPAKTSSSAGSTTRTMNAKGSKPQAGQRAPTNTKSSAKQQPPRTPTAGVVRDDLAECNYCNRRFAADRIQKHEDICSKTGKKKRKAYDATKHRVVGTELESYVIKPGKSKMAAANTKASKPSQKKDWRRTHEEFIAAIRAAKEAQAHLAKGGKLADLPPPPPSSNPDYVQCPHCGRRFNEAAAERHIPKCASFQFNKPKPGPASKSKIVRR